MVFFWFGKRIRVIVIARPGWQSSELHILLHSVLTGTNEASEILAV